MSFWRPGRAVSQCLIVLGFAVFFGLLFARLMDGAGNNWDWIFPYFHGKVPQMFLKDIHQWVGVGLGVPQSYMPSQLFQALFLPLYSLPLAPEIIQYLQLVALFTLGSSVVFFSLRSLVRPWVAVAISLAAFINPAIFYKLLAGHIIYVGAYIAFIGLLVFLLKHYRPTIRSAMILGLLLAFSAMQVQFFIFSTLSVLLFFLYYRDRFRVRDLLTSLAVVLAIHFFWISNFLFGFASVGGVASRAAAHTFAGLERTSLVNIFRLTFSDATFINRFYSSSYQAGSILFTLTGLVLLALGLRERPARAGRFLFLLWLVMILLASGLYRAVIIPGFGLIYPILREAGHAAPLVIATFLALLVALVRADSKRARWVGLASCLLVVASLPIFFNAVPRINYDQARAKLAPFQSAVTADQSTYRVISYPFFNQYQFKEQPQAERQGTPMSNTGWDSFMIFSGLEYFDNSDSQNGPQRPLLESYDLSALAADNVKYIFDLSGVYQSNADKFLPPADFPNELAGRNNDPHFMAKLIAANPGVLKQIAPSVYEITTVQPRIVASHVRFVRQDRTDYVVEIDDLTAPRDLELVSSYHPGWQLKVEPYAPLVCGTDAGPECVGSDQTPLSPKATVPGWLVHIATAHKTNLWQVDPAAIKKLGESYYHQAESGGINVRLRITYGPEKTHSRAALISFVSLVAIIAGLLITRKRTNAQTI